MTTGGASADHYLSVDGARLRCRVQGDGDAVLLLHGWTLDLDVWEAQAQALRTSFRVIRFDRRGFGRSSGQPSLERDVSDIGAVCAHYQLGRVGLVGMSQGCRAVLGFACENPGTVSCIVLDGPPEFDSSIVGANVSLAPFRELVRAHGLAGFREQWLQHPLMQLRTHDVNARELLRRIVERYPGSDLSDGASDAPAPDLSARIDSLRVAALVITGEHDLPGRVRSADDLARRLPAATRAVICDSGHLASLDNPDSYNRQLAGFLARHAASASR
jgi:3-oxoadipate enol-lactonase